MMKDPRLDSDDPRLTAYALGELPAAERAAVEAALARDPAARAAVEQIRAFAAELGGALASEPLPDIAATPAAAKRLPEYGRPGARVLRFPNLYFLIGGLAAAAAGVVIALRPARPPETKYYQEVYLNPKPAVPRLDYARVRDAVGAGRRPEPGTVDIGALVNAFGYAEPASDAVAPVAAAVEVAPAPWAPDHQLVRIGLRGRALAATRPALNLVVVVDASPGMAARLPELRQALRRLTESLRAEDRLAIVGYGPGAAWSLPSTRGDHRREILDALESPRSGAAPDLDAALQQALPVAQANLVQGGVNRIILCTDRAGSSGLGADPTLIGTLDEGSRTGVKITVLGFGAEAASAGLAVLLENAEGGYAAIATPGDLDRALAHEVGGPSLLAASELTVRLHADATRVRLLPVSGGVAEADSVSTNVGDLATGQGVTALYEIAPVVTGAASGARPDAAWRAVIQFRSGGELQTRELPVPAAEPAFASAGPDFRFAAAVAAYGLLLDAPAGRAPVGIGPVTTWAGAAVEAAGAQAAERQAFLDLVRRTQPLLR